MTALVRLQVSLRRVKSTTDNGNTVIDELACLLGHCILIVIGIIVVTVQDFTQIVECTFHLRVHHAYGGNADVVVSTRYDNLSCIPTTCIDDRVNRYKQFSVAGHLVTGIALENEWTNSCGNSCGQVFYVMGKWVGTADVAFNVYSAIFACDHKVDASLQIAQVAFSQVHDDG